MQPEYLRTLQYCQQKFQTILPYKDVKFVSYLNYQQEQKTLVQSHQIIQTFAHYEILVQLLIQNALFCKSEVLRSKTIKLLEQLERNDSTQHYQLDLSHFQASNSQFLIEASPLQKTFQIPLLKQFKQILDNANKQYDDKIILLKKYCPLIQEHYIPQYYQQCPKVRCKFTPVDEDLLYQGLQKHGSKKLELIQKEFLWDKSLKQIKNKYKNSICSNAQMNQIKQWKLNQYEYLNQKEVNQLIRGIQWFGKDKYKLIHKFFLTSRSSDFIANELSKSESLIKKRKKHNVNENYPEYYETMWNQDRKKIQLKSVQKDQQIQNFDNYFNFTNGFENSNNNSFFRSNLEISRFAYHNSISQQQQEKRPTYQVWMNIIDQCLK